MIFFALAFGAVLGPYTFYRLRAGPIRFKKIAPQGRKQRRDAQNQTPVAPPTPAFKLLVEHHLTILWVLFALLLWQAWGSLRTMAPFDPYNTLGVPHNAGEAQIKQAYRSLSLQYHPDKNPDPEATKYFASHITKAYETLTDPVKFANWQEYGHPDGMQDYDESVAMPKWMNAKSKAGSTLMMLSMLGLIIVLPLGLVMRHLMQYEW
ncbi:hypothetical protein APUTEX25_004138 [Auxenochlorella protothecoides]|uniref:J domain-containing protein n=2 Tax=Auxenochlorella protothecoides TaxID=3075 RepID=A0A3M7L5D6_AUXPR|nr:hypothetical protein APUTEX25_004138 [Auxenochlorella protothecoides]|eukprot:RMZ57304.1 hypothetical protein APUTEX25_004138 [Auxenochlorella protothecoides]